MVQILQEKSFGADCIISSLNYQVLTNVRRLDPELAIGYIVYQTVGDLSRLEVEFFSTEGKVSFYHHDVAISGMDTHIVDYGNWDGLGSMTLYIDHNSNGVIDEIIELENQFINIFLPILFRN